MKIAICGSNDENRLHLIKSFISKWPMYATPAENIFEDTKWPDESTKDLEDLKNELNEVEQLLFAKMILIDKQYENYKENGYIIYNGCGIDILVNSLILCEQGFVSEDFVEKIIYHNKKLLRKLDVVYYLPDNTISEESEEDKKILESVYWNFYDNYQTDFHNSPFFDTKNCPSILLLETNSPINEIKLLLDENGNLDGTSYGGKESLIDTSAVKRIFKKNPQLLEAALESLKQNKPQNTGSILL